MVRPLSVVSTKWEIRISAIADILTELLLHCYCVITTLTSNKIVDFIVKALLPILQQTRVCLIGY